ncbi:MAG: D-alanine--D-alanine ligase [Oscillospiraceae bacterium]|nr:D-alanine--D-alanine ligase [Oscillospiraceae bacterium]
MPLTVAVIFGGHSVEHEVSVLSGLQAIAALDRAKYKPLPLYLSKQNEWYTGELLEKVGSFKDMDACLKNAIRVVPVAARGGIDLLRLPPKKFGDNVVAHADIALPVVHGTFCEDGTVMGFLELLGVPYASSDVMASALGMDKAHMKAVLKQAGLPVLDAVTLTAHAFAADPDAAVAAVEEKMSYPVIVKPANLGSSVGIGKAADRAALLQKLDAAFSFALRALVERAVEPLREFNCAVLGDADGAKASVCEEPMGNDEILSYQDKYLSGGQKDGAGTGGDAGGAKAAGTGADMSSGMAALSRKCPADISAEMTAQIQALAVRAFQALGCMGVARVDFLWEESTGSLFVNELNTIPGSLAFYLWEAAGLPFAKLLDEMIGLAFKRARTREALTFTYESNILSNAGGAGSKGKG